MKNLEIINFITEELLKKFLSNEEVIVESKNMYNDGSGYSVSNIRINAYTNIVDTVYKNFLILIGEKIKKFELETRQEIKQSLDNMFSRDDVVKNINSYFEKLCDKNGEEILSTRVKTVNDNGIYITKTMYEVINEKIKGEYNSYFQDEINSTAKKFIRSHFEKNIQEYFEKNKEQLLQEIEKGKKLEIIVKIPESEIKLPI